MDLPPGAVLLTKAGGSFTVHVLPNSLMPAAPINIPTATASMVSRRTKVVLSKCAK